MIIDRKLKNRIESHFYNNQKERARLDELKAGIAESQDYSFPQAMSKNRETPDPTARKAIIIEEETKELAGWVKLVDYVVKKFAGTLYEEFIAMVYTEKLPRLRVQYNLCISYTTYYEKREDIILYAALKACEFGLISV